MRSRVVANIEDVLDVELGTQSPSESRKYRSVEALEGRQRHLVVDPREYARLVNRADSRSEPRREVVPVPQGHACARDQRDDRPGFRGCGCAHDLRILLRKAGSYLPLRGKASGRSHLEALAALLTRLQQSARIGWIDCAGIGSVQTIQRRRQCELVANIPLHPGLVVRESLGSQCFGDLGKRGELIAGSRKIRHPITRIDRHQLGGLHDNPGARRDHLIRAAPCRLTAEILEVHVEPFDARSCNQPDVTTEGDFILQVDGPCRCDGGIARVRRTLAKLDLRLDARTGYRNERRRRVPEVAGVAKIVSGLASQLEPDEDLVLQRAGVPGPVQVGLVEDVAAVRGVVVRGNAHHRAVGVHGAREDVLVKLVVVGKAGVVPDLHRAGIVRNRDVRRVDGCIRAALVGLAEESGSVGNDWLSEVRRNTAVGSTPVLEVLVPYRQQRPA